jgi:hypothetical protein
LLKGDQTITCSECTAAKTRHDIFADGMDTSSTEIARLIGCLDSLREGDQVADLLVVHGERAIPHLRKYLMEGQPRHIYQPRQRAVIALARLGAKGVLIEYLCAPKKIPDPVFRFGEEAVENTAARALADWHTDDVFEVLLQIAQTRTLPGIIEALGSFRHPKTIPLFIGALMDDVSRPAAENALKAMGEIAKAALIKAAIVPISLEDFENPSILLRRRSAMRILADMTVTVEAWPALKGCLLDSDTDISVSTARIALEIAGMGDQHMAIEVLIGNIPHADWYVQTEIENCLIKHYDIAKGAITERIKQRTWQPEQAQDRDRVLLILLNVRKRIGWPDIE